MPVNRNALIRYRTIDNCLRNRYRKWTLDDLVNACSDALYEYEGIDKGVSVRTVQMDIQMMRSDKLGYNAPIVVLDKKYYIYEDPDYSITNIPLTDQDLGKLTEVVEILRQFKGFTHFHELNGMVQRLEDRIHTAKTKQNPVIDLEKNENLKGLELLDDVYQAIIKKQAISITYQSFKAKHPNTFIFHPFLLKEFRNRWFMLGLRKKNEQPQLLALDRMISIEPAAVAYLETSIQNPSAYFNDVVGVSVNPNQPPEKVELFIDNSNAPYVLTKPIHHSQKVLQELPAGIVIQLQVQINFELEREILGFGDSLRVIGPDKLKRRIYQKLQNATEIYSTILSDKKLKTALKQLKWKGYASIDGFYTGKETVAMEKLIKSRQEQVFTNDEEERVWYQLLKKVPQLKTIIFNQHLYELIKEGIGESYFVTKAFYQEFSSDSDVTNLADTIFVKSRLESKGFVDWQQRDGFFEVKPPKEILKAKVIMHIYVNQKLNTKDSTGKIPNSQNRICFESAGNLVSFPIVNGNVFIFKTEISQPLQIGMPEKVSFIQLEFNKTTLPQGLEWFEKEDF